MDIIEQRGNQSGYSPRFSAQPSQPELGQQLHSNLSMKRSMFSR
jgi:hypothetical protein